MAGRLRPHSKAIFGCVFHHSWNAFEPGMHFPHRLGPRWFVVVPAVSLRRRHSEFVGTDVRPVESGLVVDVVRDQREWLTCVGHVIQRLAQVQIARRGVGKGVGQILGEVIKTLFNLAFARDEHWRAAEQVVGHDQLVVDVLHPDQPAVAAVRLMDGVMQDVAVPRITGQDPGLGAATDKVVPHDAVNRMQPVADSGGVAQSDAHVTIDDHVPLDNAVMAFLGDVDARPTFAGAALDAEEDVVADRPADRVLHIDPTDVVALVVLGRVGWVILVPLGAVIIEQAELDSAVTRVKFGFVGRDVGGLHAALPDIVDHAVVDSCSLSPMFGGDLKAVPLNVLDRQVGDGDVLPADQNQLTVSTVRPVEHDSVPVPGATAERKPIG